MLPYLLLIIFCVGLVLYGRSMWWQSSSGPVFYRGPGWKGWDWNEPAWDQVWPDQKGV